MPSLAMPKKTARETRCDRLGLPGDRTSSALRGLAVEAGMACRLMSLKQVIKDKPRKELRDEGGSREMAAAAAFLR
jgi:hypothetical protein